MSWIAILALASKQSVFNSNESLNTACSSVTRKFTLNIKYLKRKRKKKKTKTNQNEKKKNNIIADWEFVLVYAFTFSVCFLLLRFHRAQFFPGENVIIINLSAMQKQFPFHQYTKYPFDLDHDGITANKHSLMLNCKSIPFFLFWFRFVSFHIFSLMWFVHGNDSTQTLHVIRVSFMYIQWWCCRHFISLKMF